MIFQKNNPLFNKIEWVSKAVSKDPTRYGIDKILIEPIEDTDDVYIVATDGHRLHRVKQNNKQGDIIPGLYIPTVTRSQIVLTKDTEDKYPAYKNFIPDFTSFFKFDLNTTQSKNIWFTSLYKFLLITKIFINLDYFKLGTSLSDTWDVYAKNSKTAVIFKSNDIEFFIMPIRNDIEEIEEIEKEFNKF